MELQQRCKDRIEEVYKVAEAKYERTFTRVPVTFSNRMTRCAGVAKSMRFGETVVPKEIRLSNVFLKSDTENFIKDTPGHEAAHLIAGEMFGSVGHDRTWHRSNVSRPILSGHRHQRISL
jgi:predicted SprT family Zn-dependent metalloprotease